MEVSTTHKRNIAIATLKMSKEGASIMGGMNHKEAVKCLRDINISDDRIIKLLENVGYNQDDIAEFFS
jgi:hypothetical protein